MFSANVRPIHTRHSAFIVLGKYFNYFDNFVFICQESSNQLINESVQELLMFSALADTSANDVTDSSRHQFYYIINGLQPDTLYSLSLRMSNVFGFSNWTEFMSFETAEGQCVERALC